MYSEINKQTMCIKEKYEVPCSTVIELYIEAPILTTSEEQIPDPWHGGDWDI